MDPAVGLAQQFRTHHLAPGDVHSGNTYRFLGLRDHATAQEVGHKKRTLSLRFSPDKLGTQLMQFVESQAKQYTEDHNLGLYTMFHISLTCVHACNYWHDVGSAW